MDDRMPHVCGDEPFTSISLTGFLAVCPTYVGMNRTDNMGLPTISVYAPRMWG